MDVGATLIEAKQQLEALLAEANQGLVYRQGVRTAIVGRPNVGKSSLLNALLRTDRAIVTPIPGTTRDTLEETVNLRGIPLCLVDTAGITVSTDLIESLGIERSRRALQQADLVLIVVDGSEPLRPEDWAIAGSVGNQGVIVAVNKADLPALADDRVLLPAARHVRISALTREGLNLLEDAIVDTIFSGQVQTSDVPVVSNPRHCEILRRALSHVSAALSLRGTGSPWLGDGVHQLAELVTIDCTAAANALGEITGETVGEDVLDAIFNNFCIGK